MMQQKINLKDVILVILQSHVLICAEQILYFQLQKFVQCYKEMITVVLIVMQKLMQSINILFVSRLLIVNITKNILVNALIIVQNKVIHGICQRIISVLVMKNQIMKELLIVHMNIHFNQLMVLCVLIVNNKENNQYLVNNKKNKHVWIVVNTLLYKIMKKCVQIHVENHY